MAAAPTPGKLPDNYDRLVSVDRLVHGEHNPRQVRPREGLRASIESHGIANPLIVRTDEDSDVYQVTDGWQRYQAATELGWEELPVAVYDTTVGALTATEIESMVREWTTYQRARFCQSVVAEEESDSRTELLRKVAEPMGKSVETIRRYLDVLSLPKEIHPLLTEGPDGSEQDWAAVKNHNPSVKRYGDLWWSVAARLARRQNGLDRSRTVGIAAKTVEFDSKEDAIEFVEAAADEPSTPLETIQKRIWFGAHHDQYLEVPRVAVRLSQKEKQAMMTYCRERRQSLSEIVASEIEALAMEVTESDSD